LAFVFANVGLETATDSTPKKLSEINKFVAFKIMTAISSWLRRFVRK
jgi:hypothetical protein